MTRLTSPFFLVGVAVSAAALALYLSTLAPTLTWGHERIGVDGGEFLAAASTLGIPHPPGYPTYMLLLKLFATVVPVSDFAFRGNLLSAVLASGTVALLYWIILLFARFLKPEGPKLVWIASAALGATVLATIPLFWSQAVITEVYTLNSLFVAALILIAAHLALRSPSERERKPQYTTVLLSLFGLLLGLSLGNHLTVLAVAVPMLFWLWTALGWRRLASPYAVGALVLGIAVYLYMPIRAAQNPPINWGNADTLGGFVWMLSGRVYQDYVFGIPVGSIPNRVLDWVELVFLQFNPLGLFLGLIAAVPLQRRAPWFLLTALASIVVLSTYSITYHTVDAKVLTIPTFVIFSISIGVGFLWAVSGFRSWVQKAVSASSTQTQRRVKASISPTIILATALTLVALPVTSVILNHETQDRSNDREAYDYARKIMASVPDGSLVMSTDEAAAFSLWYMSFVEDKERGIAAIAVPLLQFDWYWRDVYARFPDTFPPTRPNDKDQVLRHIVEHNGGGSNVFFTYTDRFLQDNFELERIGAIYKASPRHLE